MGRERCIYIAELEQFTHVCVRVCVGVIMYSPPPVSSCDRNDILLFTPLPFPPILPLPSPLPLSDEDKEAEHACSANFLLIVSIVNYSCYCGNREQCHRTNFHSVAHSHKTLYKSHVGKMCRLLNHTLHTTCSINARAPQPALHTHAFHILRGSLITRKRTLRELSLTSMPTTDYSVKLESNFANSTS